MTARGIERMAIFEDDRDHEHFLELLEEMSNRYGVEVHVLYLNPIRTEGYGLGKSANKAEAMGWVEPDREQLKRRLKALRQFQWSSFRAYAGYSRKPEWLVTDELTKRGGRQEYRRYVQEHVTRGADPEGFEDFRGRLALGLANHSNRRKIARSLLSHLANGET